MELGPSRSGEVGGESKVWAESQSLDSEPEEVMAVEVRAFEEGSSKEKIGLNLWEICR